MNIVEDIKNEVLTINNMKINVLESINDYFNSFSKHNIYTLVTSKYIIPQWIKNGNI